MNSPKITGPWEHAEIEEFLGKAVIPMRLAAISHNGWPVVASLWFAYQQGTFYCASKKNSRIVKLLSENERCGFEVAGEKPPYFGIRGQGVAEIDIQGGEQWLKKLTERYIGPKNSAFSDWLLRNAANEVVVDSFLKREIKFLEMSEIIEECLNKIEYIANLNFEDYVEIDKKTRILTKKLINK